MLSLLGWISLAVLVALVAASVSFPTRGLPGGLSDFEVLVGFAIYIGLCFLVGAALKRYRHWGRVSGAILSVVSLPYFPFGTLIGIFTLVYLVRGWNESPDI